MHLALGILAQRFSSVWAVDFEFHAQAGERPVPLCMVARDLLSGRLIRVWQDELERMRQAPFDVGDQSLVVAYYATAEIGCFLQLGWPLPVHVVDLFVEFRVRTNGLALEHGRGLLGALAHFALDGIHALEKAEMRELAIRGGPFSVAERSALIDYCQTDVDALEELLPRMAAKLDLDRALLRGAYMMALAHVEATGVPVDQVSWARLQKRWSALKAWLVARVDGGRYGVYVDGSFNEAQFRTWLGRAGVGWPRLPSGHLRLDSDTFDAMALLHPVVAPLRDLRAALAKMKVPNLAIGRDGRNRALLSAFASKTGRNQPSNSTFIFGAARWMRFLIQPRPGRAIAYIDWSQQEFGIAAALSGDPQMKAAYESGDCYLAFAIQAGAAPVGATKATHGAVREQYKRCVLATQYLMTEQSLAADMGCDVARARALLTAHRKTYSTFWRWADGAFNAASLAGCAVTTYGWPMQITRDTKARSVYNFPMQANGSEMLRLAVIFAVEAGLNVCAPVHDAILIEADALEIHAAVAMAQQCMAKASEHVLKGFRLRTEAEVVHSPDRFPGKARDEVLEAVKAYLGTVSE